MTTFWEAAFQEHQEMWGGDPAPSALITKDIFLAEGIRTVLIPGVGYGRNARPFLEACMAVTGIEISETAIALARNHFGDSLNIRQGSVTDMPLDAVVYDGIFCYALIHLLDKEERLKFLKDCYAQLSDNGLMVFTAVTKGAPMYGTGTPAGKDRFELYGGVRLFFYDAGSIEEEFDAFGLFSVTEIQENFPFYLIQCRKQRGG